MSKQDESAFPRTEKRFKDAGFSCVTDGGLTKRELFAAMAMQSLFAPMLAEGAGEQQDLADMAICCCKAADALLAELAKEQA